MQQLGIAGQPPVVDGRDLGRHWSGMVFRGGRGRRHGGGGKGGAVAAGGGKRAVLVAVVRETDGGGTLSPDTKSLKPGDRVYVSRGGYGRPVYDQFEVAKVT